MQSFVFRFHLGLIEFFGFAHTLLRHEHMNMFRDQLQRIAVAGNDNDIVALMYPLLSHGAQNIVGFKSWQLEALDLRRIQKILNQRNLRTKLFRRRRTMSLIFLIQFMPKRRLR